MKKLYAIFFKKIKFTFLIKLAIAFTFLNFTAPSFAEGTVSTTTSINISDIILKNIDRYEIQVMDGVAKTVRVHKPKENCAVTLFMNGIGSNISFTDSDQRFDKSLFPTFATDDNKYKTSTDPKYNLYDLVKMEVENAPNCDQIIIAQSQGGLRATAYATIMHELGVSDRIKAIIYVGSPVRGWSALAQGIPELKARLDREIFNPLARAKSSVAEVANNDINTLINEATKGLGGDSANDVLATKATDTILAQMSPTSEYSRKYLGIDANYSAMPLTLFSRELSFFTDPLSKESLLGVVDNSIYRTVLPSHIKIGFIVGDESNLGAMASGGATVIGAGCFNFICWPNLTGKDLTNWAYQNATSIFGVVATLNRGAWTAESALSASKRADSTGAKAASVSWNVAYNTARAACFWWCNPSWMMDNANREWDKANRLWDDANYHESLAKKKWDAIGNAEASGPWFGSLPWHIGVAYQSMHHDGLIPTYNQFRKIEEFGGQPISNGDYIKVVHATHIGTHDFSQVGTHPDIWGTDRDAGWEKPISSTDGIIASWYDENISNARSLEEQNLWMEAKKNIIVNF